MGTISLPMDPGEGANWNLTSGSGYEKAGDTQKRGPGDSGFIRFTTLCPWSNMRSMVRETMASPWPRVWQSWGEDQQRASPVNKNGPQGSEWPEKQKSRTESPSLSDGFCTALQPPDTREQKTTFESLFCVCEVKTNIQSLSLDLKRIALHGLSDCQWLTEVG